MQGREKLPRRLSHKLCSGTNLKVARSRRGFWGGLRTRLVECRSKSFQGVYRIFQVVRALTFINRSGSATHLFVPFTWCCVIYTTCLKVDEGFPETRAWNVLVGVIAIFLDSILHTSGKARFGIAKAAKVRLRRGLRSVSLVLSLYSYY